MDVDGATELGAEEEEEEEEEMPTCPLGVSVVQLPVLMRSAILQIHPSRLPRLFGRRSTTAISQG